MTRKQISNLQIYPSTFTNDTQILRDARTMLRLDLADLVTIVYTGAQGLADRQCIATGLHVDRVRLRLNIRSTWRAVKLLAYVEFVSRIYFRYRVSGISSVSCHSCLVLPAGVLLRTCASVRLLVYSPHELETERAGLSRPWRLLEKLLEAALIRAADAVTVVSPSIVDWYRSQYTLENVHLLRNIPAITALPGHITPYRDRFNIPEAAIVFLYHGAIGQGRAVDLVLRVFEQASVSNHVVFMGFGGMVDRVIEAARNHSNIHYLPAVATDEVVAYAAGADVGLCVIENTCLSYYYCLPNKFFEYIYAGLPVIVSGFPDMCELVSRFDCGWCTEVDVTALSTLVTHRVPNEISGKSFGVIVACNDLNWESECKVLIRIYCKDAGQNSVRCT